ncbi:MAG: alpha-glucan family phosphorylase [Ectothiorhodospiraceae bacterium]|nr:alpha-glucan family phosphorylase [Ectothiorhodospiraceae bacterium]MCH8505050.1 alpha-glucan family phosphorylase [Ectothiorhodospiraceae bacterium]
MPTNEYTLEVRPQLPAALSQLGRLADNLFYSWDRRVRGLFFRMDPVLWKRCGHNPKVFLRRVSQSRVDQLARDREFMLQYQDVLAAFYAYVEPGPDRPGNEIPEFDPGRDLVAYFCMEYGLHESLQLYSGGLGILAGDHCKAASDLDLPFVAVGLMYRQGYFVQTIDRDGAQQMHYRPANLDDLAVRPVQDAQGQDMRISIDFADRTVSAGIWKADVGRVPLYLLDTELQENRPEDRAITYQLYGGDRSVRIAQEIVLGIGGVRALRALGVAPTVWHINEGHPAFLILERCRELVAGGMTFDAALEAVAAATVFTTHTAVPAGHDLFSRALITHHLGQLALDMDISEEYLLALGASPQGADMFNMTALALRGSRQHNAVSEVHRDVAADMEAHVWPAISPGDSPLRSVSNGVHIPTFLAREWVAMFDGRCPDWRQHLNDGEFWRETIEAIPNHRFWGLVQSLKSEMLDDLAPYLHGQYERNIFSRARINAMLETFSPENTRPLILGFARRFATYKRALLIFQDLERLARLLQDPERPVIILFAGKAHPQDMPGQALIRRVHEFASREPFLNRVFLIEGHDIALARKLVTGVDVWLNTPEYPMEASGTSGQKAAINGGVNLSMLDGWWKEGFDGRNGWGIEPHSADLSTEERDRLEAQDLLDLLENEVIPEYFATGSGGYPPAWVARCKRSMRTVLPRFSAERMVMDYVERMYVPAARQGRSLSASEGRGAADLAQWKSRVCEAWPGVSLSWSEPPPSVVSGGHQAGLRVEVLLNGLTPEDVVVECLLEENGSDTDSLHRFGFACMGEQAGAHRFVLDLPPPDSGLFRMRVRMYPFHPQLMHRFEMGRMTWL